MAASAVGALAADAAPETPQGATRNDASSGAIGEHERWSSLLARFVGKDGVDYPGLLAASHDLDEYASALAAVDLERFSAAPRAEQIAFWINAYNAFTVRLVLRHWPVDSIWDVTPLWRRAVGGPFGLDIVPLGHLAPELEKASLSLDDVEHRILRARFAEPRIHFALVCASRGCPPLAERAYRGATLDHDLDTAARRFLADEAKNRFELRERRLVLSPIFRWFAEDFATLGGPEEIFRRYAPPQAGDALASAGEGVEVTFSSYDWGLNAAARRTTAEREDVNDFERHGGRGGDPTTAPVRGDRKVAPLGNRGMLKEK